METIRNKILDCKRIVIKIGTSSLMRADGSVNYQMIDRLAYVLTVLRK